MASNPRIFRSIASLAACVAVLATGAACGRSPADSTNPPKPGGAVRGGTLVASVRSEPATFNRYVEASAALDVLTILTQATLVRINRATDQLEPWLAERWTESADHRTFTLALRRGIVFSDGVPFTSADVVFSFRAAYDPRAKGVLDASLRIEGKPITATAPDPQTVIITLPAPFTPGLRLLDNLWILPRHALEPALDQGRFDKAWGLNTPPASIAGLGPFTIAEHVPGQRLVLARNPHYWRSGTDGAPLPYLDRIVLQVMPDQNAEVLRLETGAIDLMSQADVRPEDYAALRRLREQGTLTLEDLGVSLDAPMLWFNLRQDQNDAKHQWFRRTEFRQAISYALDRDAIANAVYLGAAVPISGPVTPGNRTWYSESAPKYAHDPARAKALLASIGLGDTPIRFSLLVQSSHTTRQRVATMVQEQLKQIGVAVDIVPMDPGSLVSAWGRGNYDAIFHAFQASATDPANNLDFWRSAGDLHVWNAAQRVPATSWERQIDELMARQIAAPTLPDRQRIFAEVQRIMGEQVPAIWIVAPKVSIAMNRRVEGATPALLDPKVLWNADTLYVRDGASRPR